MLFAIIDFPHAVNTHNLVYALQTMLDQQTTVVSALEHQLPPADVYLVAENLEALPAFKPTKWPIWEALTAKASAHCPVVAIGEAALGLVRAGILPGEALPNTGASFLDAECEFEVLNNLSVASNQYDLHETMLLPIATEYGGIALAHADAHLALFAYAANAQGLAEKSTVAAVQSADGRFVGMLFSPERAVDDEIGNTDGRKIFWSLIHALDKQ